MTDESMFPFRAAIDQCVASAPEMARACRAYYDAFRAEGFNGRQALYLTLGQFKDTTGPAPAE